MPSVKPIADALPAPTRAARAEPRGGPPYKLYMIAGGIFALLCMVVLVGSMMFAYGVAKDHGYDPELSKRYPALALYVIGIKNANLGEDIKVDAENGVVTFRDKRSGRRLRVKELNGALTRPEIIDDEGKVIGTQEQSPAIRVNPKKQPKPFVRKSQKSEF